MPKECAKAMKKAQPETYPLVLASTKAAPVRVGELGSLQLQPGFYLLFILTNGLYCSQY